MNYNKIILMGNLSRDPEKKLLTSGDAVTNFSIAVNEYKKGDVSYFDVTAFKGLAETCSQYLSKGKSVLVEGRLQQQRWEDNSGNKKSKIIVVASSVVFLSKNDSSDIPI